MKVGFLVNPIAGAGGKVGLKGTDNTYDKALKMGAKPIAPERGIEFLRKLKELGVHQKIQLLTCPNTMGEFEINSASLNARILSMKTKQKTTAKDTKDAVKLMVQHDVDLILFVGGDGTARDILDSLEGSDSPPVLGVPSGVKMYSAIFATNPTDAAYIVESFVMSEAILVDFEIVDADETAIRKDRFEIKLYGFLKGPFLPKRIQGSKQLSPETTDEYEAQRAIARFIAEEMRHDDTYIMGPGTTVKRLADLLGVQKTLLGVDIYRQGVLTKDVNETTILDEVDNWKSAWIIVSPIGRQGILFGRGNQQISPKIIKLVGKERIIALATQNKLKSIEEEVLRVDTGDVEVDEMLRGYVKVATDYREWRLVKIE